MSVTDPGRTRSETEIRGRATDSFARREIRETKPSFMTTEFWAMLGGIVAVIVVYNAAADISLNLFRASLLATTLAVGYMISRGLAKSGSRDDNWRNERRDY
jgi:hypothetical protein